MEPVPARNIKHSRRGLAYHFHPVHTRDLLYLLRDICRRLDDDVSLEALSKRAGWSRFHLHRAFRQLAGETPKQYTQRLRLTRAAANLVTTDKTVLEVEDRMMNSPKQTPPSSAGSKRTVTEPTERPGNGT